MIRQHYINCPTTPARPSQPTTPKMQQQTSFPIPHHKSKHQQYSYCMIKLQYISWIRDHSGHVISRPTRQIANTITTFAGRNGFIDPRDGLPNTTPHIIHTFQ